MIGGPEVLNQRLDFFGHSWVWGQQATDPSRSFARRTAAELGRIGEIHAVRGSATAQTLQQIDDLATAPGAAVVMAGMNDARLWGRASLQLRIYKRLARAIVQTLADRGVHQIWWILQPPLFRYDTFPPHDRGSDAAVTDYNQVIIELGRQVPALQVVEVASWDPKRMLDADTVHPNDLGHKIIADSLIMTLTDPFPLPQARRGRT